MVYALVVVDEVVSAFVADIGVVVGGGVCTRCCWCGGDAFVAGISVVAGVVCALVDVDVIERALAV